MDVARTGTGGEVTEKYVKGVFQGVGQVFTKEVRGHEVWTSVFYDGNVMRVTNGGINP